MRTRLWTLIWILGILFPMAFLGRLWPAFGKVFNAIFAPDWMHVLMHTLLYAVLGFLLVQWMRPGSFTAILGFFGLVLAVGCLHEGFQLLTSRTWPGWNPEFFDLAVDLVGATLGLGLARLLTRTGLSVWMRRQQ